MDILVTKRLTLRPPLEVDAEAIAAHFQDASITRNLTNVPFPYRIEDARNWVEQSSKPDPAHHFTIHRERLIGVVSARPVKGAIDLGYWLARDSWGHGYATEAAKATLFHAFRHFGSDVVHSGAYRDNAGSLRVLAKLGFKPNGTVEDHFCPTRGTTVPCVRVELTRDDFVHLFGPLETEQAA